MTTPSLPAALDRARLADAFLGHRSVATSALLVPEFELHLARDARDIWQAAEEAGFDAPYWAFAWPGGQALARYILDNPSVVAGKGVLDLGAGSGLIALAAARAGAAFVLAADIDLLAAEVTRRNAALNGLLVTVTTDDLLDDDVPFDVVLIGDVVYETPLAKRVGGYVERARERFSNVLFGDRASTPVPAVYRPVARYDTIITPALEDGYREAAIVWQA